LEGHSEDIPAYFTLYMATRNLQLHIVTVGTAKIGISEPNKYSAIGDIVGVKLAGTGDTVDDSATVGELKKRGKIITLAAIDTSGKSHRIQCAIDKVASAISSLKGKQFGAVTIKSVSIPRKRSRR
jgi:glycine cleavage system H lipoate-binding protein